MPRVLQPGTRACPGDRPHGEGPTAIKAGSRTGGYCSSPLRAQKTKRLHKRIPFFLAGMSTACSSCCWDLGVGRAPPPPPLGRVLVLAGSAPYEGASWASAAPSLEPNHVTWQGARSWCLTQPACPQCPHLLQSTGVWLTYISWWDVHGLFPSCPSGLSALASTGRWTFDGWSGGPGEATGV